MTIFQQQVYKAIEKIPAGQLTTYGRIARFIKKPRAARAVGQALGANLFSYLHPRKDHRLYPCHRVVGEKGLLGGFTGGQKRKITLLEKEGCVIQRGRVLNFREVLHDFRNGYA